MRGTIDGERIALEDVHRFANGVADVDGHLRWDFTRLHREVLAGLERIPEAASVGIDTWGVDYGLLDANGELLAEPIAYRDERTSKVIDDVHGLVGPDALYTTTGIQFLPFNTIYQLAAEQHGPRWERARHAVLLPDLIAYRLTGELRTELTNASTTGLLEARTHEWSSALFDRLALPRDLFPALQSPGEIRGATASGIPVVTVGSHDTASAVVGVPATTERFAYIASGTWSLVGVELDVAGALRRGTRRELHQRARRRRPHPVPAQRRRNVAAAGMPAGVATRRPLRAARRGGRVGHWRAAHRRRRSLLHRPGTDARTHHGCCGSHVDDARPDHTLHRRLARRGLCPDRARRRWTCPAAMST